MFLLFHRFKTIISRFKLTYANEIKIVVTAFDTDETDCSSGYLKTGERTCE